MSVKKLLRQIDRTILGGVLARYYVPLITKKGVSYKTGHFNYSFNVHYQKNDDSLLNILTDKYGSDKGEVSPDSNPYAWPSHNYADFYSLVFGLRRNDIKSVI